MPGNNCKIQKCDKKNDMFSKRELAKDGNSRECVSQYWETLVA